MLMRIDDRKAGLLGRIVSHSVTVLASCLRVGRRLRADNRLA
jgi:hypothetical protein